jgi:hypothetical protein
MKTFRIPDKNPDPRAIWRSWQCGIITPRFRKFGCGIYGKHNISCSGCKRPEKQIIPSQLQDGTIAAILRPSPAHRAESVAVHGGVAIVRRAPRTCSHSSNTVTLTSTNDSMFIFKDGELRPGTYKTQNVVGQTYVEMLDRAPSRHMRGIRKVKVLPVFTDTRKPAMTGSERLPSTLPLPPPRERNIGSRENGLLEFPIQDCL